VSIEMDIARTAPSILDFDHEKYVDRVARARARSRNSRYRIMAHVQIIKSQESLGGVLDL